MTEPLKIQHTLIMERREQNGNAEALGRLVETFDRVFLPRWNTRLVGGFVEPLYLPATPDRAAEIRFTRDYLRSALHEIAHWCIAGPERRELEDYGYPYRPDGRSPAEQEEFFRFEVRPQALELEFSRRCGLDFQVSVDNLNGGTAVAVGVREFASRVARQREAYERTGFPPRAEIFMSEVLGVCQTEARPFGMR